LWLVGAPCTRTARFAAAGATRPSIPPSAFVSLRSPAVSATLMQDPLNSGEPRCYSPSLSHHCVFLLFAARVSAKSPLAPVVPAFLRRSRRRPSRLIKRNLPETPQVCEMGLYGSHRAARMGACCIRKPRKRARNLATRYVPASRKRWRHRAWPSPQEQWNGLWAGTEFQYGETTPCLEQSTK